MKYVITYDIGEGVRATRLRKDAISEHEALAILHDLKASQAREICINDPEFRRKYTEKELEELTRA